MRKVAPLENRATSELRLIGLVAVWHRENGQTHRQPCELLLFRLKPGVNDRLRFSPDVIIQQFVNRPIDNRSAERKLCAVTPLGTSALTTILREELQCIWKRSSC